MFRLAWRGPKPYLNSNDMLFLIKNELCLHLDPLVGVKHVCTPGIAVETGEGRSMVSGVIDTYRTGGEGRVRQQAQSFRFGQFCNLINLNNCRCYYVFCSKWYIKCVGQLMHPMGLFANSEQTDDCSEILSKKQNIKQISSCSSLLFSQLQTHMFERAKRAVLWINKWKIGSCSIAHNKQIGSFKASKQTNRWLPIDVVRGTT